MSNLPEKLGEIGIVPNSTVLHGAINGDTVRGVTTSTWNIRTGGTSRTSYTGNQTDITAIATQCQQEGYEYSITGGKVWKIDITYPVDIIVNTLSNEPAPIPTWEISYKQKEQPLYQCLDSKFVTLLTKDAKDAIENKLKDPNSITPLLNITSNNIDNFSNKERDIIAPYTAYNLKLAGVEGKTIFVPTLKRTIVTSNNESYPFDSSKDNKLFTRDELVDELNELVNYDPMRIMPDSIKNMLPNIITVYKIGEDGVSISSYEQEGMETDTYTFQTFVGYLQLPTTAQTLGLNKIQWTTEWIFNRWSAGAYGLYVPVDGTGYLTLPDPAKIIS